MSDEPRPYSPLYIQAWTALSIALGLALIVMFVCGDSLLGFADVTWKLLRWLARGII